MPVEELFHVATGVRTSALRRRAMRVRYGRAGACSVPERQETARWRRSGFIAQPPQLNPTGGVENERKSGVCAADRVNAKIEKVKVMHCS